MQEGTILRNNYRLDRLLGRGGMADVYLAFDFRRQAYVAVKILREDLAEDPDFLRRFGREAEALARLDHPNVVRFYSLERQGATAFIVMDFVPGTTLQRRLAEADGPLPIKEATAVLRQVGAALQYAHTEGYIHRDIKPGNIMLREDGTVLLSDFGIARAAESATMTTMALGTPAYTSPEQIRGRELDRRTDIYSLGVVLFEMVTGRRPFTGDEQGVTGTSTLARLREAHLRLAPPDPRTINPAVPARVAEVILRALAKDPEMRWPDVLTMIQAWESALGLNITVAAAAAAGAAPTMVMGAPSEGAGVAAPIPVRPLRDQTPPREATPIAPAPAAPASPAAPIRTRGSVLPWLIAGSALALLVVVAVLWRLLTAGGPGTAKAAPSPTPGVDIERTAQALAALYAQATSDAAAKTRAVTAEIGQLVPQATVQVAVTAVPVVTLARATPIPATATVQATPVPPSPTPSRSPTPIPSATPTPKAFITVNSDEVNIRSGPGTMYNIVGTAAKGQTYTIVSRTQAGDWLRLEGNDERWVSASLVTVSGEAPVASKLPPTPVVSATSALPILLSPVDGYTLWPYDKATFEWKYNGPPLGPNQGFELRIWKEGNPDHPGAAPPVPYVPNPNHIYRVYIGSIRACPGVKDISTTDWINVYWTVAIVQIDPYRRIGPEPKPFWIHT